MRKEKYIIEKKYKDHTVFEVNFRYNDLNGIEQSYSKSFNSLRYESIKEAFEEAVKDRDKVRSQIATVGKTKAKKTLKDVYKEMKELFPQTPETFRKYDVLYNHFIKKLENRPIDKITAKDITMSLNKAMNKSQDSINRLFTVYKKIFKCAIINEYIYVSPLDKVQIPKSKIVIKPKSVVMECTINDVIEALSKTDNYSENSIYNNKLIIYAIYVINYLGLRPAECYALSKKDIDFKKRTVNIDKAVGMGKDRKPYIRATKNQSSVRILPIPDILLPILQDLCVFQKNNQLFTRYNGQLLSSEYVSFRINQALKKKGMVFRMYMLRHKFSTDLLMNGVDVRTIMELMGHTNSSMTIEYARSDKERKMEAINKIE